MSRIQPPALEQRSIASLLLTALILGLSLLPWPETRAEQGVAQNSKKTRFVSVVVKRDSGELLKGAQVTVVNGATMTAFEGQEHKLEKGSAWIVVPRYGDVRLLAAAPGHVSALRKVDWVREYTITLVPKAAGAATPGLPVVKTAPAEAVVKPTRVLSVVVEGEDRKRLRDAVVTLLDADSKAVVERKLLVNGFGSFNLKIAKDKDIEVVAEAPGRVSQTSRVGRRTASS